MSISIKPWIHLLGLFLRPVKNDLCQRQEEAKWKGDMLVSRTVCSLTHWPSMKVYGWGRSRESRQTESWICKDGHFATSFWVAPYHFQKEGSSKCQLTLSPNQLLPQGCLQFHSQQFLRVRGYCTRGWGEKTLFEQEPLAHKKILNLTIYEVYWAKRHIICSIYPSFYIKK